MWNYLQARRLPFPPQSIWTVPNIENWPFRPPLSLSLSKILSTFRTVIQYFLVNSILPFVEKIFSGIYCSCPVQTTSGSFTILLFAHCIHCADLLHFSATFWFPGKPLNLQVLSQIWKSASKPNYFCKCIAEERLIRSGLSACLSVNFRNQDFLPEKETGLFVVTLVVVSYEGYSQIFVSCTPFFFRFCLRQLELWKALRSIIFISSYRKTFLVVNCDRIPELSVSFYVLYCVNFVAGSLYSASSFFNHITHRVIYERKGNIGEERRKKAEAELLKHCKVLSINQIRCSVGNKTLKSLLRSVYLFIESWDRIDNLIC